MKLVFQKIDPTLMMRQIDHVANDLIAYLMSNFIYFSMDAITEIDDY